MVDPFHQFLVFILGLGVGVKLRDIIDVLTGQDRG